LKRSLRLVETITRTVKLHPAQSAFRRSTALYRGFVGGRGSGKSWAGAYDLIRRAKRGRTYLAASPTGVLLQDTSYPTFKAIAEDLGVWGSVKLTPYPNATLTTGAVIRFRSAEEPDKLRGPNLSGVWLDEASLMARGAYDIAIACLREQGEQGWLSATFTPKGLGHWTYEVFGQDPPRPDTQIIHAGTADNPFLPADFRETLERQYGQTNFANQELRGLFVSIDGAEWPSHYFDHAAFWFDDWPTHLAVRTLALDPSKGSDSKLGDYSAYVKYGRDFQDIEYIEADLSNTRDSEEIVDAGIEHVRTFKPDGFAIEGNAFQFLFAPLFRMRAEKLRMDLPVYLVDNTVKKVVRIRRLTEPLRQKVMRFRNTPGTRLLVQQLRDFPVGEKDDGPDAVEMARRLAIELHNEGAMAGFTRG
jgi:phage terminase large subunit-like protein